MRAMASRRIVSSYKARYNLTPENKTPGTSPFHVKEADAPPMSGGQATPFHVKEADAPPMSAGQATPFHVILRSRRRRRIFPAGRPTPQRGRFFASLRMTSVVGAMTSVLGALIL